MLAFLLVLAKQRVQRARHPAQPQGEYDSEMRCPGDGSDSVGKARALFHSRRGELFHFGTTGARTF